LRRGLSVAHKAQRQIHAPVVGGQHSRRGAASREGLEPAQPASRRSKANDLGGANILREQYLLVLSEMKKILITLVLFAAAAAMTLSIYAQQVKRTPFDVTNYVMDVSLVPSDRKLNATVDVTFVPLEDTRSVAFELNGSLKVDSITRVGAPMAAIARPAGKTRSPATVPPAPAAGAVTFIQDQTNSSDLGPHVRVDLGDNIVKGTPVTLRFKYSGVLEL